MHAMTQATGECVLHVGRLDRYGYGKVGPSGKAHRIAYETHVGPIADGLTIDHLCRNRACVNPDHLEAVPRRVNTLRGIGPTAINAAKTHCKRGHEFSPESTYISNGTRQCRPCNSIRASLYKARKSQQVHR